MRRNDKSQWFHGAVLLGAVVLVASACSSSGNGPTSTIDGSVCGEYVVILTEESARFAELLEPSPNSFDPATIAAVQSEEPGSRTLADIDRILAIHDSFIEDFETAAERLATATAGVGNHALSGYGQDLEDVFLALTQVYTQSRDELQEAMATDPDGVLLGNYFNIVPAVSEAVNPSEPLASFQAFGKHLADNCPALQTILVDAWRITNPPRTGYSHWDTTPLLTTTVPPIP